MRRAVETLRAEYPEKPIHLWHYRAKKEESTIALGTFPISTAGGPVWRDLYFDWLRKADLLVAEALALHTGGVVRMRNGATVTRSVLYGEDPLHLNIGGSDYDISFVLEGSGKIPILLIFTKSALELSRAEAAYGEMSSRFGCKLVMQIRNDQWFLDWGNFPIYNPFVEQIGRPPSPIDFRKIRSVICRPEQKADSPGHCLYVP